jgi:membrane fusion protein (multidrug efflux system)
MRISKYLSVFALITSIVWVFSGCKELVQQKPPPPDIQVMQVIQKDVPIQREFVGQIYGLKDIPIRARVEGYLIGIHFEEGSSVERGQLLYTIDSQPFEAEVASMQNKVAEARTYLTNAENELARYKPLAKINAVSKSDLDRAQASRDAAEASFLAARANLEISTINLGYCTIRSPIDGLIGKTNAREGEFVGRDPNPVILNTVSNVESTRIEFFLTEAEFLMLAREVAGREERIESGQARDKTTLSLILSDGSLYTEKGLVDFVDRSVDASTGSILVQATFPNPRNILRPGMYAKVRVEFETAENSILVPQRCIMELQGQYSVYTVTSDNVIKQTQVTATTRIDDLWLIQDGLTEGDRIVIDGLQKVASGMEINPVLTEYKSQTKEQG